ncbi:hypothetical protein [Actinokineospora enzanensis]|uniref:hypothetical protein n=1 Tax=Actinokineospora enzanensis TaxID=155975 RepID=UPI00035F4FBA|nr:hypothetical protein [Actinokineospora enzanensis]
MGLTGSGGLSPSGVLAIVLVTAPLLLTACAAAPDADADADRDLVACLSPAQLGDLARSAVTLRVAQPDPGNPTHVLDNGASVDMSTWRERHPDDFDRACAAIRPTDTSPDDWTTTLLAALNVLVGAVIGYGSAALREYAVRARRQGQVLRTATTQFAVAARLFVGDSGRGNRYPSDAAVLQRHAELSTELRLVARLHPHSTANDLLTRLAGPLGPRVFTDWTRAETDRVGTALVELERDVAALAAAVERPWARRGELRANTAEVAS